MAELRIAFEDLDLGRSDFDPMVITLVQSMKDQIEREIIREAKSSDEYKRAKFLEGQIDEKKRERDELVLTLRELRRKITAARRKLAG